MPSLCGAVGLCEQADAAYTQACVPDTSNTPPPSPAQGMWVQAEMPTPSSTRHATVVVLCFVVTFLPAVERLVGELTMGVSVHTLTSAFRAIVVTFHLDRFVCKLEKSVRPCQDVI